MTSLLQRTDGPADAELIAAVRDGDTEAYGLLFERHVDAARRLARQLVRGTDADDLVAEAFAKVLAVLQRGGGPDQAFRAYLLTAVRRLHVDRVRSASRVQVTDDLEPFDPGVPFRDTAVEGFDASAAARAFASLPERWQLVLWHTEVEEQKPADVAPLLGISPNSVSALAYRAREGLRQAYLSMHAAPLDDDTCAWVHGQLGGLVRGGLSRRDTGKVEAHLDECRACAALLLELTDVNSRLGALLAPLLLGSAATGYLAATTSGGVAAGGVVLALLDRAKDVVVGNAVASSVAGVAATAVIGGAVVVSVDPEPEAADIPTPGADTPTSAVPQPEPPTVVPRPRGGPERTQRPEPDRTTPSLDVEVASPPVGEPVTVPPPEPPSEQPSPTEQPDPVVDVAVGATPSQQGNGVTLIEVVVTGLPEGRTAVLTSHGEGLVIGSSDDPRCEQTAPEAARCSVAAAPAPYSFTANAPRGGSITFTVTLDDAGPADASPANDSVVVPIV